MKVLQLVTLSQWGGAQRVVLDYSEILRSAGYTVFISASPGGELEKRATSRGISFFPLRMERKISPFRDLSALLELRKLTKKEDIRVLHAHSTKAGFLARNPYVPGLKLFTAHGWCFTPGAPGGHYCKFAEKIASFFSWKIICVSRFDLELALKAGIKGSKLLYIPNGIRDTVKFADPARSDLIVSVARFSPQKDYETLLLALSELSAEAWLAGEGPLLEKTKLLAKKMGLSPRVNFKGFVEDVEGILARAGIFVLSSRWEGLPLSIIEAMRAGLPVVATDVGGVRELVKDGINGFLVPPRNPAALRDRLKELLQNPALREEMGRRGREIYLRDYTFERMKEAVLELYRSLPL